MATFQIFAALCVVAPAGCFAALVGWLPDNSSEERRYKSRFFCCHPCVPFLWRYRFVSLHTAQNVSSPNYLMTENAWVIMDVYRVSQEECAILRESVPYVKLYRYNPKHLYPKLNGYGDNGQGSLKL